MESVAPSLFVGSDADCPPRPQSEWATVHACKHPCHATAVGGNVTSDHPNYLVLEEDTDLFLNIVDMDRKQQHRFMAPLIEATLAFIADVIDSRKVLIHCNQGRSRSPSLALLYLAKRDGTIPDETYEAAARDFRERYPAFDPGRGIDLYLEEYWNEI